MKKNIFTTLWIGLVFILNAQNGAYIEYKITSSKGNGGTMKMKYSEFGSSSVFNMLIPQMPGGGITMKSLSQKSKPEIIYLIDDKNKTYSETKRSDLATEDNTSYTVKKLGTEIVNGYKCTHALVTEGKESHEVWNTKDLVDFNKYAEEFKNNKRIGSAKREQALKAAGCDGLPVKTVHKGNAQEGDMTMELVKIEKKNFTKSDFELPAGYTKTEGGGMGVPKMKSQQEIMNMSEEEREKYMEEMKKMYGGGK